jgi:hypothetical protein
MPEAVMSPLYGFSLAVKCKRLLTPTTMLERAAFGGTESIIVWQRHILKCQTELPCHRMNGTFHARRGRLRGPAITFTKTYQDVVLSYRQNRLCREISRGRVLSEMPVHSSKGIPCP